MTQFTENYFCLKLSIKNNWYSPLCLWLLQLPVLPWSNGKPTGLPFYCERGGFKSRKIGVVEILFFQNTFPKTVPEKKTAVSKSPLFPTTIGIGVGVNAVVLLAVIVVVTEYLIFKRNTTRPDTEIYTDAISMPTSSKAA